MKNEAAWAKDGWTDGAEQTKASPSTFREVISCQGKQWCGIKVGFWSETNERLHRKGFGRTERKIVLMRRQRFEQCKHARAAALRWILLPRWGQLFSDLLELSPRPSESRVASTNMSRSWITAEAASGAPWLLLLSQANRKTTAPEEQLPSCDGCSSVSVTLSSVAFLSRWFHACKHGALRLYLSCGIHLSAASETLQSHSRWIRGGVKGEEEAAQQTGRGRVTPTAGQGLTCGTCN